MKKIAAIVFAALTTSAHAQVFNGQSYGDQQFGAWTGHLVSHGNDSRFRASAVVGNWSLNLDVVRPSCGILLSTTLWVGSDPVSQDISPYDFAGMARVDQETVWDMKFSFGASMGDQALMFIAYPLPDFGPLLTQMENGTQIRLKFEATPGKFTYASFPLNGFSSAIRYETGACMRAEAAANMQPKPPSSKPNRSNKPDSKIL